MYIIINFDNGTTMRLENNEAQEVLDLIKATTQTTVLMKNDCGIQMMRPNSCFINIPSRGYININHVCIISVYDEEEKEEYNNKWCESCKYWKTDLDKYPCEICSPDKSEWESKDGL